MNTLYTTDGYDYTVESAAKALSLSTARIRKLLFENKLRFVKQTIENTNIKIVKICNTDVNNYENKKRINKNKQYLINLDSKTYELLQSFLEQNNLVEQCNLRQRFVSTTDEVDDTDE